MRRRKSPSGPSVTDARYDPPTLFARLGLFNQQSSPGKIAAHAVFLLETLLFASDLRNPRGITEEARKQLLLGSLYSKFAHTEGARLRDEEIGSHVHAALTPEPVNLLNIQRGTRFKQHTRPNGWCGDYWTDDPEATPSTLGISEKVIDPAGSGKEVERLRVWYVVVSEQPIAAAFSTAREVDDFWSIPGKNIHCEGGGRQFYMPMTSQEKASKIRLILPEDEKQWPDFLAVAKKNGLQCITSAEMQKQKLDKPVIIDFSEKIPANNPLRLQEMAYALLLMGHIQSVIDILETYLECENLNEDKLPNICVLSCLYALSNQMENANKFFNSFLDVANNLLYKNNEKIQQLALVGSLHLARSRIEPKEAIKNLLQCLETVNNSNLDEDKKNLYRNIIHMEIGIQSNRQALEIPGATNYSHFDKEGYLKAHPNPYATEAFASLNRVELDTLPPKERIIVHMEKAFAAHKQGDKPLQVLASLNQAKEAIADIEQEPCDQSQNTLMELNIQKLAIELAQNLCLATMKGKSMLIPEGYENIDPVEQLLALSHKLNKLPVMQISLLFKRWFGPSANDLYIVGWHDRKEQSKANGADLVSSYRRLIPLDLNTIIRQLEENEILALDLSYLGASDPGGISDKDFKRLCDALAQNTSLRHCHLRKFSMRKVEEATDPPFYRAKYLFKALSQAQEKGQRLEYLNVSASHIPNLSACTEFLSKNQSLKIFVPSLYYERNPARMRVFADSFHGLSELRYLRTGLIPLGECHDPASNKVITECPGKLIYEACQHLPNLHTVSTWKDIGNENADENNRWLRELDRHVKARHAQQKEENFAPQCC